MSCEPNPAPPEVANAPLLQPSTLAKLVLLATDKPVRVALREADAVTALRRGLAEYLSQVQLDVSGEVVQFARMLEVWSDSDTPADYPSAVVQIAGEADYDASSFTPNVDPTDRLPTGEYLVKHSEVTVLLQVEAHCSSPGQRVGVAMLLEDAVNPVSWMHGFRLDLPFYYGQRAEYQVTAADFRDDAGTARHELRPLTLTVEARISQVRVRRLPILQVKLDVQVLEPGQ